MGLTNFQSHISTISIKIYKNIILIPTDHGPNQVKFHKWIKER